jgi:hypothetical protein
MLLVAVVAVLYAVAALSYKGQAANWKKEEKIWRSAQKKAQEEKALIAARGEWEARYEQMYGLMPVFPYDRDVDTYWLNLMDTAAKRNDLFISRQQAGKEVEVGDVYELPIDCKAWEGTLESLVKFLYDLQKEGAMLDVRQLFVQPVAGKPGQLKGTFLLTCAYMRGEESPSSKAAKPDAAKTAGDAPPKEAKADVPLEAEMPDPTDGGKEASDNPVP